MGLEKSGLEAEVIHLHAINLNVVQAAPIAEYRKVYLNIECLRGFKDGFEDCNAKSS